jgi:hypothetical protein
MRISQFSPTCIFSDPLASLLRGTVGRDMQNVTLRRVALRGKWAELQAVLRAAGETGSRRGNLQDWLALDGRVTWISAYCLCIVFQ